MYDQNYKINLFIGEMIFLVEIEFCINCSQHFGSTRHDQQKYLAYFQKIKQSLTHYYNDIKVHQMIPGQDLVRVGKFESDNKFFNKATNKIQCFPRLGAFEVYVNQQLIFSKLQSNKWPKIQSLINKILQLYLRMKEQPKDLNDIQDSEFSKNISPQNNMRSSMGRNNKLNGDNFRIRPEISSYKKQKKSITKYGQLSKTIEVKRNSMQRPTRIMAAENFEFHFDGLTMNPQKSANQYLKLSKKSMPEQNLNMHYFQDIDETIRNKQSFLPLINNEIQFNPSSNVRYASIQVNGQNRVESKGHNRRRLTTRQNIRKKAVNELKNVLNSDDNSDSQILRKFYQKHISLFNQIKENKIQTITQEEVKKQHQNLVKHHNQQIKHNQQAHQNQQIKHNEQINHNNQSNKQVIPVKLEQQTQVVQKSINQNLTKLIEPAEKPQKNIIDPQVYQECIQFTSLKSQQEVANEMNLQLQKVNRKQENQIRLKMHEQIFQMKDLIFRPDSSDSQQDDDNLTQNHNNLKKLIKQLKYNDPNSKFNKKLPKISKVMEKQIKKSSNIHIINKVIEIPQTKVTQKLNNKQVQNKQQLKNNQNLLQNRITQTIDERVQQHNQQSIIYEVKDKNNRNLVSQRMNRNKNIDILDDQDLKQQSFKNKYFLKEIHDQPSKSHQNSAIHSKINKQNHEQPSFKKYQNKHLQSNSNQQKNNQQSTIIKQNGQTNYILIPRKSHQILNESRPLPKVIIIDETKKSINEDKIQQNIINDKQQINYKNKEISILQNKNQSNVTQNIKVQKILSTQQISNKKIQSKPKQQQKIQKKQSSNQHIQNVNIQKKYQMRQSLHGYNDNQIKLDKVSLNEVKQNMSIKKEQVIKKPQNQIQHPQKIKQQVPKEDKKQFFNNSSQNKHAQPLKKQKTNENIGLKTNQGQIQKSNQKPNEKANYKGNQKAHQKINQKVNQKANQKLIQKTNQKPIDKINQKTNQKLIQKSNEKVNQKPIEQQKKYISQKINQKPIEKTQQKNKLTQMKNLTIQQQKPEQIKNKVYDLKVKGNNIQLAHSNIDTKQKNHNIGPTKTQNNIQTPLIIEQKPLTNESITKPQEIFKPVKLNQAQPKQQVKSQQIKPIQTEAVIITVNKKEGSKIPNEQQTMLKLKEPKVKQFIAQNL